MRFKIKVFKSRKLNLNLVLSLVIVLVLLSTFIGESSAKKRSEKSGVKKGTRFSTSSGRTFNKRTNNSGTSRSSSFSTKSTSSINDSDSGTKDNVEVETSNKHPVFQHPTKSPLPQQVTISANSDISALSTISTDAKEELNKEKLDGGTNKGRTKGATSKKKKGKGGAHKHRESFGLSMTPPTDLGIQDSSWVGIDKVNVDQVERGGIYADGLDLDFTKVYVEPQRNQVTSAGTTPSSSVELGTLTPDEGTNKIDLLEKRIGELEKMMMTVTRNIEVMQQNTQVISKGFNILSGRVNKVSADHEQIHTHMGQGYKVIEQKVDEMFKNLTKSVTELDIKSSQEIDNLKKGDLDLLESQVVAGQECHSKMETFNNEINEWKTNSNNETKILAEMVKALAEISKTEKVKLENLTDLSHTEFTRLDETIKKCQVEDANGQEAFATKIRVLKSEFEESNKTLCEAAEKMKSGLGTLSQHLTEQVKRIDEAILEQNMAHNMAHENIAAKLDELDKMKGGLNRYSGEELTFDEGMTTTLPTPTQSSLISAEELQELLKRLDNTDVNISTLFNANRQFLSQVAALEDSDQAILNKIAELRNVHKDDNSTARKEIYTVSAKVNSLEDECQEIKVKVDELERKFGADKSVEIGGMSMRDPTSASFRLSDGEQTNDVELSEFRDRFGTIEENVGELWRSQKDLKNQHESFGELIKEMQNNHAKMQEESSLQIMEVKIATKMLTEVVRNSTKNLIEIEKRIEHIPLFGMSGRASGPNKNEIETLKDEMKSTQESIANLWETSRNVSKAQEFFLFKLLEMDLEHKSDNKTVGQRLMGLSNRTEDVLIQISRADDRINKVVQQFEITDAEQMKMREELLNIKDRLASSEENHKSLWKSNKKLEAELDEVANNVDNAILIHKTEHRNISGELAENREKVGNLTKNVGNLNDRVSNIELVMDMEVSGESNSSELTKLKSRLMNSEKDITELWKSMEIASFQQQVLTDHFKTLQTVHENETSFARLERMKTKFETVKLFDLFANLTQRVSSVEKCTNPPYETRTIDLEIGDWRGSLAAGLKNEEVSYELGKLLDLPSSWKAFVEINGNHLSIFNTLLRAEGPIYNEFQAEILDSDGKTFASYGPDLHLYKGNNEKIGWTNVISIPSLENPENRLLTNNALKLRFRVKVFPKFNEEEVEEEGPSEKQLIQWEVRDLMEKLKAQEMEDYQAFLDLNVTKEFGAGHFWEGHTLWRSSLLVREINHQNYLGLNMELIDNDGNWKELFASYNVTLLDSHSRIVKEFSIASNDFKSVSARHSYFMLVKDVEEVLRRGDLLTIRIYFDLRAKRRSFDVEVIR